MSDIYWAYAGMAILSAMIGLVCYRYLYPRTRDGRTLLLTLAVGGMFAFMLYVAGQLYLAKWIPHSAAIVWTNVTPILAAIAAATIMRFESIPLVRRLVMLAFIGVGGLSSLLWPSLSMALRPPPEGDATRRFGVVYQSAPATCSPAAAATLLWYEGIEASEAEMIPLCLTDEEGTPTLGLYRGIKLKADSQNRRVEIVQQTIDELFESEDWPTLLTVKLPRDGVDDPRYEQDWGWIPGMGHSVVALRKHYSGKLLIGDPALGIELWDRHDLEVLWHGEGIRIEGTPVELSEDYSHVLSNGAGPNQDSSMGQAADASESPSPATED